MDDPRERLFSLLHPVFRDCVDADTIRCDCSTPFPQGGYVYATDARVAVRTPLTAALAGACALIEPTVADAAAWHPAGKRRPPVHEFFADRPPAWFDLANPLPAPDTSGLKVCPQCKGVDKVPETVEEWDDYDEDGLCLSCGGSHIEGNYLLDFPVGAAALAPVYARILDRHGATLYLPVGGAGAIRFTVSPGVEGLVMPLDPGIVESRRKDREGVARA